MIKVFLSHVCDKGDSCTFAAILSRKLAEDVPQVECFLSCDGHLCLDARELNKHVNESVFFVPIVNQQFGEKPNCLAELKLARERKRSTMQLPVILPVKFFCNTQVMYSLDFQIDQGQEKGEIWIEVESKSEYEKSYQELLVKVLDKVLNLGLLPHEDFNKDRKVLDLILREKEPTSFYVKTAIEACKKSEEYGLYFFKKLDNTLWLTFLDAYGFFEDNPEPIEVDPEKEKGMFTIPLWPVLFYLEKISARSDGIIAARLIKIIRSVTEPRPPLKVVDNHKTWWFFAKVMSNLPSAVIELKDIEMLGVWLNGRFDTILIASEISNKLLPKLLHGDGPDESFKAIKIVEIVTKLKWIDRSYPSDRLVKEPQAAIQPYWLRELFVKNVDLLGKCCGQQVIDILMERLKNIVAVNGNEDEYSYIWRPAIEEHEQNVADDRLSHVMVASLRDVLLSFASYHDASALLLDLLKSELNIFGRLVLYVIDVQFSKYAHIFWGAFNRDLFKLNFRHELYLLLNHHFGDFTQEEKDKVLDTINGLTEDWREGTDKTRMDALLRAEWMHSVIGKGHSKADPLYQSYVAILGQEPAHAEFISFHTAGGFSEEAGVSAQELLTIARRSIKELVHFLNSCQMKNFLGEPAYEGIGQELKAAVKTEPTLFEKELRPFMECKFQYQEYLIEAFRDLWKEKKSIDWENVLKYCEDLVNLPSLWKEAENKDRYRLQEWLPTTIAQLIRDGVNDDDWAFDPQFFPSAERILKSILERQPSSELNREDAVNWAINTPKGRTLEAFFSYSLRVSRIFEKQGAEKKKVWDGLKDVFDKELDKTKAGNYEFSALVGEYLPNLYYLSSEWITNHFSEIFPHDPKQSLNWRSAMDGYSYVATVYPVIYSLLKQNGDFSKVLEEVFDQRVRKRVIENVAITYLRGNESLKGDGSLFAKLLSEWRLEDISDVISLFWVFREATLGKKEKARIFDFWQFCYELISSKEQENQEVLSDLNLLAVFLDKVEQKEKKWLLQCSPFVEKRYHASFLLEYFDRLADVSSQAVGEVFLHMLNAVVPTFKEENVKSIVEKIYKSGLRNLGNQICDRYIRKSHEFLTEVHDRNND